MTNRCWHELFHKKNIGKNKPSTQFKLHRGLLLRKTMKAAQTPDNIS